MLSLLFCLGCGDGAELTIELEADDGSTIAIDGEEVVVTDGEGNTVRASGSTTGEGEVAIEAAGDEDVASIKIGDKGVEASAGEGKAGLAIAEDKVTASAGGGEGVDFDVVEGAATFQAGGGDEFEMSVGQGTVGIKGGKVNIGGASVDFKKKE
ncbi:MAG TPA: hypothetical protein QGF58_09395 [Myxococcota bacterium]|nr:hypothetical protein [Myxococcota bacterium]